jgi:hypothetical protein
MAGAAHVPRNVSGAPRNDAPFPRNAETAPGNTHPPSTSVGSGGTSTSSAVMVSPTWPGAGLGLNGQQAVIRLQGQIVHVVG